MSLSIPIQKAARILKRGGVIAYPTEGVFGLGCLPDRADAVARVLAIKQRDASRGLILIASTLRQLAPWGQVPADADLQSSPEHPVTWIVPAQPDVPYRVRGKHETIAVRITSHAVAASLCDAVDSAIVSTSANLAGRPTARNALVVRRRFGRLVDYIVPGHCGPAGGASEIRDLASGRVLRAAELKQ